MHWQINFPLKMHSFSPCKEEPKTAAAVTAGTAVAAGGAAAASPSGADPAKGKGKGKAKMKAKAKPKVRSLPSVELVDLPIHSLSGWMSKWKLPKWSFFCTSKGPAMTSFTLWGI